MDGIYDAVRDSYKNRQACHEDILLLEKLINTELGEVLPDKVKEDLKSHAVGEYFSLGTLEHVMKIFCIFQEGKLRSEIPGVSGLGRLYELLPIKPEKEIRNMMRALVNQYEYSQSVAESRHAAKYKDLQGEEYISVMDVLDAAFLTTFTKAEREEFGTRDNPALQFYQAMKKDKNELLTGCLVMKKR